MIAFGEGALPEAAALPEEEAGDGGTATVTVKAKVNLRSETDKNSDLVAQVAKKGTEVTILDEASDGEGTLWYYVRTAEGEEGYVRSDMLKAEP